MSLLGSRKNNHVIHITQRGYQTGASGLRRGLGGRRPSDLLNAGVGIDADYQHVAFGARGLKIADVADVQDVEAAIGEDHALPLVLIAQN